MQGSLAVERTVFALNSAQNGGAIHLDETVSAYVHNSTITENSAYFGAGFHVHNYMRATISNSTLYSNSAISDGAIGAAVSVDSSGAHVIVANCTLSKNVASKGAAVGVWSGASAAITHSVLSANTALDSGHGASRRPRARDPI